MGINDYTYSFCIHQRVCYRNSALIISHGVNKGLLNLVVITLTSSLFREYYYYLYVIYRPGRTQNISITSTRTRFVLKFRPKLVEILHYATFMYLY